MAEKLSVAELAQALAQLPKWSVANGKLLRTYSFGNFIEAMSWMSAAALAIHDMDHHPEWFNVYSTVRVELVTHSSNGITAHDVELAKRLETLAGRWPQH